ncbi:hypothetical protein JOQ06_020742, partial [Pogonophryne albipinna]
MWRREQGFTLKEKKLHQQNTDGEEEEIKQVEEEEAAKVESHAPESRRYSVYRSQCYYCMMDGSDAGAEEERGVGGDEVGAAQSTECENSSNMKSFIPVPWSFVITGRLEQRLPADEGRCGTKQQSPV